MDEDRKRLLSLEITARTAYLRVVMQFVESSAIVFGLKKDEYLPLCLAVEEIYVYLCNFVCPGKALEVQCFNGLYYIRVLFRFSAAELNLSGLNIASTITHDRESDLDAMGLMIASRSVDQLNIIVEKNNRICLAITKEKSYPTHEDVMPLPQSAGKISLEIPGAERLKCFAMLTGQSYAAPSRPSFLTYPGKVVDMVAGGEYGAMVALNPKKEIIGGILFYYRTEKIVQCFGPYSFHKEQEKAICETLMESCIGRIARTKALGLLSLSGLPESLRNHFETLGSLLYYEKGKAPVNEFSFYRHLHEDPGVEVWSCKDIDDYLRREYDRLALARDIRTIHDMGETHSGASLFSAEVHRDRHEVTLRPLWPGDDFSANVERHIRFLRNDHLLNIYFELDLGVPWHVGLIPVLMENRFIPGFILPFAGQSDLLIFQHHDDSQS
ncbi:MAG: hypothetical protein LUO89_08085 [Methanothrix sp.]|nr:hypothetical protein [Methanothrix sp.]